MERRKVKETKVFIECLLGLQRSFNSANDLLKGSSLQSLQGILTSSEENVPLGLFGWKLKKAPSVQREKVLSCECADLAKVDPDGQCGGVQDGLASVPPPPLNPRRLSRGAGSTVGSRARAGMHHPVQALAPRQPRRMRGSCRCRCK